MYTVGLHCTRLKCYVRNGFKEIAQQHLTISGKFKSFANIKITAQLTTAGSHRVWIEAKQTFYDPWSTSVLQYYYTIK